MSPIRPDLPTPRHAATHPVATTTARVAQAAFFQQALAGVRAAQQSQPTDRTPVAEPARRSSPSPEVESSDRQRRPGSLIDIRV